MSARDQGSMVERAIAIAVKAHKGQRMRNGQPYILHPMWIMAQMDDEIGCIVAALHDVVEDSDVTLDDLRAEGFSERIVAAVDSLTHRPDEAYEAYIERLRRDALACRVKLVDLQHNMDIRRLDQVSKKDVDRFRRYLAAYQRLNAQADA